MNFINPNMAIPLDEMSMFHGKPRKFGSVIQADAPKDLERDEQLRLCKWLKQTYPHILFRSDIQSACKLSPQMQNIKQIVDPYSGWPDVTIYLHWPVGIELKRVGASLSGEHWRNQQAMHERLRKLGWSVHVCFGCEEAKAVVRGYMEEGSLPF